MRRVTVITAIYDDFDDLKPTLAQEDADVEWICVTDRERESNGWRVWVEPKPELHPSLAVRWPKALPWLYADTYWSIWIDASFLIKSPRMVADMIPFARPIAQFKHYLRDCIYAEAEASKVLPKYQGLKLDEQVASYRESRDEDAGSRYDGVNIPGHPEHWGLWATGVIARQHTPAVINFGNAWLRQSERWGFQDQISEPPTLARHDLRPADLPGCFTSNPWVEYRGSARH